MSLFGQAMSCNTYTKCCHKSYTEPGGYNATKTCDVAAHAGAAQGNVAQEMEDPSKEDFCFWLTKGKNTLKPTVAVCSAAQSFGLMQLDTCRSASTALPPPGHSHQRTASMPILMRGTAFEPSPPPPLAYLRLPPSPSPHSQLRCMCRSCLRTSYTRS